MLAREVQPAKPRVQQRPDRRHLAGRKVEAAQQGVAEMRAEINAEAEDERQTGKPVRT